MKLKHLRFLLILGLALPFYSCSEEEDPIIPEIQTENIEVGARSTFLRVDDTDDPASPTIVKLSDLGIVPGDNLVLRTIGNFFNSTVGDTRDDAIGVFSASDQLLGISELNRVVDAIDAGFDRMTDNTFEQNQTTDIPEDFRIDENPIAVFVPENAQFLFLGNADSKQSDNNESPDGFFIEIRF